MKGKARARERERDSVHITLLTKTLALVQWAMKTRRTG